MKYQIIFSTILLCSMACVCVHAQDNDNAKQQQDDKKTQQNDNNASTPPLAQEITAGLH